MDPPLTKTCPKCGGTMERGFTTAAALIGGAKVERRQAQLVFVLPGTATSRNPVKAFKQGMSAEPADRPYRIFGVRCSVCGLLELYGDRNPVEGWPR